MNWNGVRPGDPPGDEDVLSDCGLVPFGVDNCNEGKRPCSFGSGVVNPRAAGAAGGSEASCSVAELIHCSSFLGGDGGSSASSSAK
jgi:hypothetical protein